MFHFWIYCKRKKYQQNASNSGFIDCYKQKILVTKPKEVKGHHWRVSQHKVSM